MSSVILRLLLWVVAVVVTVSIGVFVYNHLPVQVRDIAALVLIITAPAAVAWAINQLEELSNGPSMLSATQKLLIDEAITRIVDAQMWAVKAITAK